MLALFEQRFPGTGLTGLSDGVDLSGWQDPGTWWPQLGWAKWSCAKVTEGTGFTERTAVAHSQAAQGRGIPWGLYHFAKWADPTMEAQRYLAGVEMVRSSVGASPAFHMLDLEAPASGDVTSWSEQWCRVVEATRPAPVVIYTGPSWANTHLRQRGTGLENRPLWIAHYANAGTTAPWVPSLWADWTIWQWQSVSALGHLDVNVARPSFLALLGGAAPQGDNDLTPEQDQLLKSLVGQFRFDVYAMPDGTWKTVSVGSPPPDPGAVLAMSNCPQGDAWAAETVTIVRGLASRVAALEQKVGLGGGGGGATAAQILDEAARRLAS